MEKKKTNQIQTNPPSQKKTKQTNQPKRCGAVCVCLLLRGAGLAVGFVVSLRVDGGDGHRRAWDGIKEGGGQLGANIQQALSPSRACTP